jgi:hypothetical protein
MVVACAGDLSVEQYLHAQAVRAIAFKASWWASSNPSPSASSPPGPAAIRGTVAKRSAFGVGEAATSAAVLGITLIVVSDALFAVIFNLFNL